MKPNSIVFKVDDKIHIFLLDMDKKEIFDIPSIPISDEENIYEWMKPSQISFAKTMFFAFNDEPIKIEEYKDFENIRYKIKDLFSITITDKEENEVPVSVVLREGFLNNVVKNFLDKGVMNEKRLGFVSNSSSSSYIIIGAYLSETNEDLMNSIEKRELDVLFNENEGKHLIGKILNTNSNEDPKVFDIDIKELHKIFKRVEDELIFLKVDPENMRLYHIWL